MKNKILVAGAGGFIGGHLVAELIRKGHAPKGVNGRNSENKLIQKTLGWEPNLPLRKGMEKTYAWIYDEMIKGNKGK